MERICPYCMHILSEETSCPGCGKKPGAYRPSSHHFAPGTRLHARYLLGRETSLTLAVTCYTDAGQSYYEKGREQFLKEARTMAKLEDMVWLIQAGSIFLRYKAKED